MFSERLKLMRKRRDYTQQQLAEIVNTKKTTISNYETGYSTPSHTMLVDLADALEVTTDYLLGRVNTPSECKCKKMDKKGILDDVDRLNNEDAELLKQLIQRFSKDYKY